MWPYTSIVFLWWGWSFTSQSPCHYSAGFGLSWVPYSWTSFGKERHISTISQPRYLDTNFTHDIIFLLTTVFWTKPSYQIWRQVKSVFNKLYLELDSWLRLFLLCSSPLLEYVFLIWRWPGPKWGLKLTHRHILSLFWSISKKSIITNHHS